MSKAANTIKADFWKLQAAAEGASGDGHRRFHDALDAALKGEREHRAMGRRFTDGRATYAESALTAARYFVVKWFCDHDASKPVTFRAVAGMRPDAVSCAALREILDEEKRNPFTVTPETMALDYVKDIVR